MVRSRGKATSTRTTTHSIQTLGRCMLATRPAGPFISPPPAFCLTQSGKEEEKGGQPRCLGFTVLIAIFSFTLLMVDPSLGSRPARIARGANGGGGGGTRVLHISSHPMLRHHCTKHHGKRPYSYQWLHYLPRTPLLQLMVRQQQYQPPYTVPCHILSYQGCPGQK